MNIEQTGADQYYSIPFTPKSIVGWGASKMLVNEINLLDPKKVLILVDPVIEKLALIKALINEINLNDYEVDVYSKIPPEPTLEIGNDLVKYVRKNEYSVIIGIGGGSVLDMAKIGAVFARNKGELKDYLNLTATRNIKNRGLYTILVPTTSGTGSEVTDISVLELEGTKDVINHEYLKAGLAIVDPKLTVTVPPNVTAATGIDALTHAIESYLSIHANPVSDGHALEAIKLIGRALPLAVKDGTNMEARIEMSFGSYMAGLSFHNAGVGAVHALAYPLGSKFHLAHGVSNAVMLPYVLDYIYEYCESKFKDILQALGENVYELSDREAAFKCVAHLSLLVQEVGIPRTLKEFSIPESALPELASDAMKQNRLLSRCPVSLDEERIYKIYLAAYIGD